MFRHRNDRGLKWLLSGVALICGSLVIGIVGFLLVEAWPVFSSGQIFAFFSDGAWQPGSDREPQFGITPMLLASLAVTLLATALAVPPGILAAIFQIYYSPKWLATFQDRAMELLAGVPSIIFGFWGLTVIVPIINQIRPPGQSLLAGGIVLGLMILPTVSLTTRAALQAIDRSLVYGGAALGLSRPRQIFSIALPAARSGILSGCMLAMTRAIGETMAVVMVCGNIAKIPHSIFDPVRPVTSTIALEMGYATEGHRSLLYAAGFVLVVLTGFLLLLRRREPVL
ncbi:MAG: phosphate ABC transporter permease subunit PstC [Verrucomicrobiales bacterium]|nr:phosphate ABC transporter permease subunit PstC [Verrucomicrobiales bacterium]